MFDADATPEGVGLFQPVLSEDRPPEPLYSNRALFFTAFFGGAIAVTILSALNSRLLNRLNRDIWMYALAVAAVIGVIAGSAWLVLADPAPAWFAGLEHGEKMRAVRYAQRGLGLLLWGGFYLAHRKMHRAADLAGLEPRSPWKAAIVASVISIPVAFIPAVFVALALAVR